MLFAIVVAILGLVGILVAVGIWYTIKVRRRMLNALNAGLASAPEPGAQRPVYGAGGMTAEQTTAIANNFLGAFGAGTQTSSAAPTAGSAENKLDSSQV